MSKQILVLTGSPRKKGNSDMMADAFIQGARSVGHHVDKFETARKKISGCINCDACWRNGTACSIKDDFKELEPLLESADVIAFASPLYWFGMSSQIKAAIDRLYAYDTQVCIRPLKIKESAFMICAALDDLRIFDGAIETYKGIARYLKWQNKGILAVPAVSNKGDIVNTNALNEAEKLGASI